MKHIHNHTSPQDILRSCFGYDSFWENQEEIIRHLMAGRDALVLMPTGGGKSICYQIPAMLKSGVGVVISPLIALMQDQVDALCQLNIRAAFLNSSLSPQSARDIEKQMVSGNLDLVYVAPERLTTDRFLDLLNHTQVALFAIDEAHCVSQWGHDFRPEYLQLSILSERFPKVPRIALTATADPVTRKEIIKKLNLEKAAQFITSFDRPNICYRIELKEKWKKQLLDFLNAEHPKDSGIVYCLTRKKVETTAAWLSEKGYTALPYHAGMDQRTRLLHQRRFLHKEGVIIVATIAFGMGIDKPDVRFIAHLDLPKSLEAYYQETGRGGRDGQKADAWMIYSLSDVIAVRALLDRSEGDEQYKSIQHRKLEAFLGYCETVKCRRQVLLSYFGEELPKACGNCDTCHGDIETWDGTVAAQKALSCVYRTGQRFGAEYLSNVLCGSTNERIQRFRHDKISTFGIGADLSKKEWKSIFRQMIAAGLLFVDLESKGGFKLTDKSWPVLRGEQSVRFRKDPMPIKAKHPPRTTRKYENEFVDQASTDLWEKLRALRLKLAKEQGLPPYIIFHDRTLQELVAYLPRSLKEMSRISGIGERKLELYGEKFLGLILEHLGKPKNC
ncbi:MAG: DNA helicase RecQ [Pseudomonadota bacterium]|uniref:DNA helicase RecQ n=1 Tax=Candidatus Desulfatibia profunda TaxID=2841695 RepID=A0A8J6NPP7_9BACT|nr:DNA helicase RecQ [Candidatus Desulfatibia profunda]MBL7180894.1 DNA helicase RecQ [Desulfobacterales bacterium]